MGRLVFLILLVVIAVYLVRRALARASGEPPPAERPAEELVRCAHCSVLLPRGEARMASGALYCSEEHARLGPARR